MAAGTGRNPSASFLERPPSPQLQVTSLAERLGDAFFGKDQVAAQQEIADETKQCRQGFAQQRCQADPCQADGQKHIEPTHDGQSQQISDNLSGG